MYGWSRPEYGFADLANLIQKVRVDFGAIILFDEKSLDSFTPDKTNNKALGYTIAKLLFNDGLKGTLFIIATTSVATIPADVLPYKKEHPLFPHEPTSDQFYDEQQLEAYRELGFHITYNCINSKPVRYALNKKRK